MSASEIHVPSGAAELPDEYVASFGKDAAVGCFTAAEPLLLSRRDRVLLRTPRGLEIGAILGPATIRQTRLLGAHVRGDLMRPLTSADDSIVERMAQLAGDVLSASERVREETGLSVCVIDAEAFFDLRHALLHILHPDPDDLGSFAETLSRRLGVVVRLANLALSAEAGEEDHGCGKPDCGKTDGSDGGCSSCSSGGCSTGGCATGCGHGATDLRPYFAHLREQMESHQRVPLV
jgi:hypothetical protein